MNGNLRIECDKGSYHLGYLLFSFYLHEVTFDILRVPLGCALNFSKVKLLRNVDISVLVAPTAQALQVLVNTRITKLYRLLLKLNV